MRLVMTEENSVKKQEEIVEYDILRIGVTFLVVLGHCAYYVIATPYGGMDYSPFISHDGMSKVYAIAVFVVSQIYLFHMELYFTLSGALFYHSYRVRGGTSDIKIYGIRKQRVY